MSTDAAQPDRRRPLVEAVVASAIVTAVVTVASTFLPDRYVATAVGFLFLGATWALVWRGDDQRVERSGLALGGLVLPGPIDRSRLARSVGSALLWAGLFAAITFVPFFFGWRTFWHARGTFGIHVQAWEALNEIFGQLVIIALPEEAFYRGYLQSRLDEAFPQRIRVLGASVGPALIVTSVIFALGHFATIREPARLAVFFPSLVFGWLRARTGGIGAGVAFHASCNVFSEVLGRGYRIY
ncbi:MAG TPA: MrtC family glutamic-type intramembrane protease [Labilithrix sp.]|nr:MrtC family glutamic-type intramembrane protease [Labilithrix sp.]